MLRLLLPLSETDAENDLRCWIEGMITNVSEQQALTFIKGPARFLINSMISLDDEEKLKSIYKEAAHILYDL